MLIGGGDMPPTVNWKQRLLAAEFYFRFQFRQVSSYATFTCVIIQNFSLMTQTGDRFH